MLAATVKSGDVLISTHKLDDDKSILIVHIEEDRYLPGAYRIWWIPLTGYTTGSWATHRIVGPWITGPDFPFWKKKKE